MNQKNYYITTPIYYASGKMHIGHTYCTVLADVMARYKRLRGYKVRFLTGTDEYGQKISSNAKAKNMAPQEFVDLIVADTKELWTKMNISYDYFIRTSSKQHGRRVQKIFDHLYKKGDIYKSWYEGWYCMPCESFFTETQLKENHTCPDCKREVQKSSEESYFFRLSAYEDRLKKWYEENEEGILPNSLAKEMMKNFIAKGLADISVSRSNVDWGVKGPFDEKHTVYVWIDALSNYISSLDFPHLEDGELGEELEAGASLDAGVAKIIPEGELDFSSRLLKDFWPCDFHLVGKEIFRFHTIIWPALLMALDLPLPKKIYGHGWILFDDDKMSKSKGNIVDPRDLADKYSVDALRYFLMRETLPGNDFSYSKEKFVKRINADLANDLGNLQSRTVAMIAKYFGGSLPKFSLTRSGYQELNAYDLELLQMLRDVHPDYCKHMDKFELNNALIAVFRLISRANKYIDESTPWLLAKDEKEKNHLAFVLNILIEVLARSAYYLSAFVPATSKKIMEALGLEQKGDIEFFKPSDENFWLTEEIKDLAVCPPLFPRIDIEKELDPES